MNYIQPLSTLFFKLLMILFFFVTGSGIDSSLAHAKEVKAIIKVPELHTVREGENLWDLSIRNYEDPYQWRSIWRKNKYVDNPDLIFPGDQLYLPGRFVEQAVVQVFPDDLPKKKEVQDVRPSIPLSPLNPPNPPPMEIISEARLRTAGYIVPTRKWVGKILYGKKAKTVFSMGDSVFIQLAKDDVAIGETLTIVSTVKNVKHPITGRPLGYLVQEVGSLVISEHNSESYLAEISASSSLIDNSSFLILSDKRKKPLRELMVTRKEKNISGIIATGQEGRYTYGLGSIVYINVGSYNGVEIGDRFVVFKNVKTVEAGWFEHDQNTGPKIIYGKMEVFTVKPGTSAAVIVESSQEVFAGAKIMFTKK